MSQDDHVRKETREEMHLICDESGRILYADKRASRWMTGRRRNLLELAICGDDSDVVDAMGVTVHRMDDGDTPLRHVSLSPPSAPTRSAWEILTDKQRDIVELALNGLTNSEIARLKRLSASTVKYHLRTAAARLDVSGRAELQAVLGVPRSN